MAWLQVFALTVFILCFMLTPMKNERLAQLFAGLAVLTILALLWTVVQGGKAC